MNPTTAQVSVQVQVQGIELQSSGLSAALSAEPMVALYPDAEFPDAYHLLLSLYIPDGVTPRLDKNFDTILKERTEAGVLTVRQVAIDYDDPKPGVTTWSLWKVDVDYTVTGEHAQALRVKFIVGDPETSRGTVTTVKKT